MKRGDGHLLGDAAGRLQLELGWLLVVESVDNEINTVAIDNSQIANDNLQVMCSMRYWPVCMLDQMVNIS